MIVFEVTLVDSVNSLNKRPADLTDQTVVGTQLISIRLTFLSDPASRGIVEDIACVKNSEILTLEFLSPQVHVAKILPVVVVE